MFRRKWALQHFNVRTGVPVPEHRLLIRRFWRRSTALKYAEIQEFYGYMVGGDRLSCRVVPVTQLFLQ